MKGDSTVPLFIMMTFLTVAAAIIIATAGLRSLASVTETQCWNTARSDIESLCFLPGSRYAGACRFPKTGTVEVGNCIEKVIFFNREDLKAVIRENNLEDVETGCVENVQSYIMRIPRTGIQSGDMAGKIKEFINKHIDCMDIKNTRFTERIELPGPDGAESNVYCLTVDLQPTRDGQEFIIDYREAGVECS